MGFNFNFNILNLPLMGHESSRPAKKSDTTLKLSLATPCRIVLRYLEFTNTIKFLCSMNCSTNNLVTISFVVLRLKLNFQLETIVSKTNLHSVSTQKKLHSRQVKFFFFLTKKIEISFHIIVKNINFRKS